MKMQYKVKQYEKNEINIERKTYNTLAHIYRKHEHGHHERKTIHINRKLKR